MWFLSPEVLAAVGMVGSFIVYTNKQEKRMTRVETTLEHIQKSVDEIKDDLKCR